MKKKTHETFLMELQELNPNVETLGQYTGANEEILARCKECNHKWVTTPHALLCGRGCAKCAIRRNGMRCRKSEAAFKQELAQKFPKLHVKSTYTTSWDDVTCYCDECRETFDIKPAHLLYRGCKVCNLRNLPQRSKMSEEEFTSKCAQLHHDIEVLRYTKASSTAEFRCLTCGCVWETIGSSVLSGTGCPTCCLSHGEKKVKEFLEIHHILYEPQKTFADLFGTGGGLLSYDFFLPEHSVLIEYQGEYHYGKGRNQTAQALEKQREHDRRKKQYARQHSLTLWEIPYTDLKHIDIVLNEFFNNLQNPVTITA